jgi:hypothetical protein
MSLEPAWVTWETLSQREKGRGEEKRGRFEDAMLLALNMEEEVISQKMQAASRSWKRKGALS